MVVVVDVLVVVAGVGVVFVVVEGGGVAHFMWTLCDWRGVSGSIARAFVSVLLSVGRSFFHFRLLCAMPQISAKDRWGGTSWKMFPSLPCVNCTATASLSSRSPCIRRMCPSHFLRRCRIAPTRSYVRDRQIQKYKPITKTSRRPYRTPG